jgi:spore germination protein KC
MKEGRNKVPCGKKSALTAAALVTFTLLAGCSIQRDIGKLVLVRSLAVDPSSTLDNGVKLTVETEKTKPASNGQGGAQKRPILLISEGSTVFDAARNFSTHTGKSVFWGHTNYYIIGEAAAKEDIRKYLDFFARDHEVRLNAVVAVVQGRSGEELLKSGNEDLVTRKLMSLFENAKNVSLSRRITLIEFFDALNSKYSAAILPSLRIEEKSEGSEGRDFVRDVVLDGYAVFQGTRLKGYITGREARGLNWVTGDVKSGIIEVKDRDGKKISLEIIGAKSKIKTELMDGIPNIAIQIEVNSNIGELQGTADVFQEEALSNLEEQQADVIRNEIYSVIDYAKQNNTDILGLGDELFHQHPVQWKGIEDQWSELFPKSTVYVEVESNIRGVYNIVKAVRSWEGPR